MRVRFGTRAAVVGALWGVLSCAGPRGAPIPANTPPIAREASSAEAPVQILLQRTELRLESDGTYTETFFERYRILDQQGVENWGETQATYSPWYMARPEITATVTSPGGATATLDPKTLGESAEYPDVPDTYSDAKVVRGPLPGIVVGAVVDEKVVSRATRPFFVGGSMHGVRVQSGIPRDRVEVVVDVPEGLPFHYEIRDAKIAMTERPAAGGRRHIEFSGGPYPAIDPAEDLLPSDVPAWPGISMSTATSWHDIAEAYAAVVAPKLATQMPPELLASVRAAGDATAKASAVLRWVKDHVRYAAIEFGDSSIIPSDPATVVSRGYGDCKDQATLLAGLLRAAGLPAAVALLRSGPDEDVRPDLPSLEGFDHAIVVVRGDTPLWIDPTVDYVRAGDLPTRDQDRLALIADPSTEALARTPAATSRTNTYAEVRRVDLADHGRAKVVETTTASGSAEESVRSQFAGSRADLSKGLQKYIGGTYNAQDPVAFDATAAEDLAHPFSCRIEATGAGTAVTDATSAEVLVNGSTVLDWLPKGVKEDLGTRKADLVMPSAVRAEIRYEIHPPPGFVPDTLPSLSDAPLGPFVLHRAARADHGVVEVTFSIDPTRRRLTPAEVTSMRTDVAKVRQEAEPRVKFVHEGEQLMAQHKPREGLAAYQRWASQNPSSGVHRARLAVALVGLGFGEEARQIAARAVDLEPGDWFVHRVHADVLSRDTLGRYLHKGFDRAGAIAEYRKVSELYPVDIVAPLLTGLLLEYSDDGVRYGGPDLAKAVEQYDGLDADRVTNYDGGSWSNNVIWALLWQGRFDEVKKRLAAMPAEKVPPVAIIVATAATTGAADAIAEAGRIGSSTDQRAENLRASAQTLSTMRRYPVAGALFQAASLIGGTKATAFATSARVMAKVHPVDPATLPARTPLEFAIKASMMMAAADHLDTALLRTIAAPRAWNAKGESAIEQLATSFVTGFATGAPDASRTSLIDVITAMAEGSVTGSDAVGYRVNLRLGGVVDQTELDTFVTKEREGYRIRALAVTPDQLGAEAYYWAGHGEAARARQWLDWARDLVAASSLEDAFRLRPFARLWTKGATGDPALPAAALCAEGLHASECVPALEAARKTATSPEQQQILDHALLLGYEQMHKFEDALHAAERLRKALPASELATGMYIGALENLQKFAEVRTVATAALGAKPDDVQMKRTLMRANIQLGAFDAAEAIGRDLQATGKADGRIYNSMAWARLFAGKVREEDLERAQMAVQGSRGHEEASLHTLACLYAELDRPEDARHTLEELLSHRTGGEPEPDDRYVTGRIAEDLGLSDVARSEYAHVTKDTPDTRTSVFQLAQGRLKKLRSTPSPSAAR